MSLRPPRVNAISSGQIAEVPRAQAGALDSGLGIGERELRSLSELPFEREQVAADRELRPRFIDHAEIHAQMRGQLFAIPCFFGDRLADAPLNEFAKGVGK